MTLDDVAAAAGVSRMTASYSFNRPERVADATRQRVMAAAEALGFRGPDPSGRFLRQGALRSLGLVLGESLTYIFEDPQATRFVAGLAAECADAGYGLTIIPTSGGVRDIENIGAAAVDAFVVWTTTADDPALEAVRGTRRPVAIHGGPAVDAFDLVGIDNRAAARALAAEVWANAAAPAVLSFPLDRERRGGIRFGLDPSEVRYPVTRDRLAGFQDAAVDAGFDWARVPIVVCESNSRSGACDAVSTFLSTGQPIDALSAMSDQLALGGREALRDAGRAEHAGIAIGGFDDSEDAAAAELTSIHQSLYDQGVRSARLALRRQKASAATDPWRLVRRASTSGAAETREANRPGE